MVCATSIKWENEAKISGFFSAMPAAEMPSKIEKITTAIVDVFRAPVISRKGFSGMKLSNMLGMDTAFALAKFPSRYWARATSAVEDCKPIVVR